jgi:hypothetical protein
MNTISSATAERLQMHEKSCIPKKQHAREGYKRKKFHAGGLQTPSFAGPPRCLPRGRSRNLKTCRSVGCVRPAEAEPNNGGNKSLLLFVVPAA